MPFVIVRNDITNMQVDAIVNTTNEEMVGYSGVDLAVHTAAGSPYPVNSEVSAPDICIDSADHELGLHAFLDDSVK